jgi:hypothetical protein
MTMHNGNWYSWAMGTLHGAAMAALLVSFAHAGERPSSRLALDGQTYRVTPNPITKEGFVIRDRTGKRVGTVEPNPILKDEYVIRDRQGRRIGTLGK